MTREKRSLRYGLLLESTSLAKWQVEAIDLLDAIEGVELCVVGLDSTPHARPTARELLRRHRLAWTVFSRLATRGSVATARVDISERVSGLPLVPLASEAVGAWHEIAPDAAAQVRQHAPDFLLRFGSRLIRGPILDSAPLGVWSFHHGDERVQRGGPPCFWELVDGDPVTGVLLQRLNDRIDGGVPLARAHFATVPHSYRRNRDQAYLGGASLPAQVCRRVLSEGSGVIDGRPSDTQAPVRRPPSGQQLLAFLSRLAATWVRRQFSGITRSDRWHVGVLDRPISSFLEDPSVDGVRWLPRPAGSSRYVADPFGVPTAGGVTILVEDYDHGERHGRLSAYRIGERGEEGPIPVKSFPSHASYPSLTEVDGEWWCVPETAESNQVAALKFDPDTLELDELATLLEVALIDPTLFEWQGRWWLLGTDRTAGANSHLRGWWAHHPKGPWHPHAVDPLKIDVRNARPAGTPFVVDGVLYRPAQDCSRSYGGAVVLNRVDRLNPSAFEETPVQRVQAAPGSEYPDGVHTLSGVGEVTLIDGTRHRFSWPAFAHELRTRARRLAPRRAR